jgi:hypothetical protein
LKKAGFSIVRNIEETCRAWFRSLLQTSAIDVSGNPVVLIFDAIPPDVWMLAQEISPLENIQCTWNKLKSAPRTVSSIQAMFGLTEQEDPADVLPLRGFDYYSVNGMGEASVTDLCAITPGKPQVIRISAFDKAAHQSAALMLHDMPQVLAGMFRRHVIPLGRLCVSQNRKLVITADHGISWNSEGLSHGIGGVFEETVMTAVFSDK